MCGEILAKIINIQFHGNVFNNFRVVTWRKTDRNRGNKRLIFITFFPELTQTDTQLMYIAVDWCYRETELLLSVLLYSTFTVQILYKLYSLQLNCTYSNYTEAAATCSAAQKQRNCQADVFWSEVQTLVWNYIVTHIKRLDPPDSRYWLQAQCRNLTLI
jgi:hypothetical protein